MPPNLLEVGHGDRLSLQDEAVGYILVQRVAKLDDDISQLGGQRRMEEKPGGEIMPFLQEMALPEGHERESLQGFEDRRDGLQGLQLLTAGSGGLL
jgi:hypothetical protein